MQATLKYISLLALLLFFVQCKKTKTPASGTAKKIDVPLDFTFTGNQWPYQLMIFTSNQSDTSLITWDFGDSVTSHQRAEEHIYEHEGLYTVSLSGYGTSVSKTIKIDLGLKELFLKFSGWRRDAYLRESTGNYNNPWRTVQQQSNDVSFYLDYEVNKTASTELPYYVILPEDTVMGNTVSATKMPLRYRAVSSLGFGDQPQGSLGGTSCTIDLNKNSAVITHTIDINGRQLFIEYFSK